MKTTPDRICMFFLYVFIGFIMLLSLVGCAPTMPRHRSYGDFSFEEARNSIDMSEPSVKTDGFVNVEEYVMDETLVIDRAKAEVDAEYDVVAKAYDRIEDVWSVQFGRIDDTTRVVTWFETVYLSGKGITLLLVYEE